MKQIPEKFRISIKPLITEYKTKIRSILPVRDLIDIPYPNSYYLEMFLKARAEIERARVREISFFPIEVKNWIDSLALITQVTYKKSNLDWSHGYDLYKLITSRLTILPEQEIHVFESGTARGFSSLVMTKAILDSGKIPNVITIDILGHARPRYWNCIGDIYGRRSRVQLLADYKEFTGYIKYIQCRSGLFQSTKPFLNKIDFAFLDGPHTYSAVKKEFEFVRRLSDHKTFIILDDVDSKNYPGVFRLYKELSEEKVYKVTILNNKRGLVLFEKVLNLD